MKKTKLFVFITIIVFSLLLLAGCSSGLDADDITAGMTFDDYAAIVPEEERFDWLAYSFFQTGDGKTVAVEFEAIERTSVVEVHVIEPAVCTEAAVHEIERGTKLLDILRTLGFPSSAESAYLWFTDENGTQYRFLFDSGYFSHGYSEYKKPYHFTSQQLSLLKADMTLLEAVEILGDIGEVPSSSLTPQEHYWKMDDGRTLCIVFHLDLNANLQGVTLDKLYSAYYAKEAHITDENGNRTTLFSLSEWGESV